ncbi:unnamed protein product [Urochloa humidicola]
MLIGAALMDEETRNTVVKENPAALLALCWYWASGGIGNKDLVVLPYKDSLLLLSRYLQKLVMVKRLLYHKLIGLKSGPDHVNRLKITEGMNTFIWVNPCVRNVRWRLSAWAQ